MYTTLQCTLQPALSCTPYAVHCLLRQAVRLQELKFQMAVRDQIINEQRDVISNLWQILGASGLSRQQVVDIARAQGIVLQVCDGVAWAASSIGPTM